MNEKQGEPLTDTRSRLNELKAVEPVVAEAPPEEMLQDFGRFVVAILGERNQAGLAGRWRDSLRQYREAMAVVRTSAINGEHDAQQQAARDAAAAAAERFRQVDSEVQQVLRTD